jgi:hypothetical protein
LDSIRFSADDNLEILCIAPWQIEKFESAIDIFINSRSFVEMPINVIKNYADKFDGFPESKNAAIALSTYSVTHAGFDPTTTLHPSELPKAFKDRKFDYFEVETLLNSARTNLFFVSPGKLVYGEENEENT